jgi:hypothetical protein
VLTTGLHHHKSDLFAKKYISMQGPVMVNVMYTLYPLMNQFELWLWYMMMMSLSGLLLMNVSFLGSKHLVTHYQNIYHDMVNNQIVSE